MSDELGLQRQITVRSLKQISQYGFVLAGSGAIREHGIVDRYTRDVDLFTNNLSPAAFATAVHSLTDALGADGYGVDITRRTELFAAVHVTTPDGRAVEVELAIDWRGQEPAQLQVGPVLHADDAVASKLNALYTRAEARDYIDADAIRSSGRYTDTELIRLAADRDAGFDPRLFADQLDQIRRIPTERFTDYDLNIPAVDALRDRTQTWAAQLRTPEPTAAHVGDVPPPQVTLSRLRTAGYLAEPSRQDGPDAPASRTVPSLDHGHTKKPTLQDPMMDREP